MRVVSSSDLRAQSRAWFCIAIALLIGVVVMAVQVPDASTPSVCPVDDIPMVLIDRHDFDLPPLVADRLVQSGIDSVVIKDIVDSVRHIVDCRSDDVVWSFWVESGFEPGQCLIRLQEPTRSALGLTGVPIGVIDQQMRIITAYFWSLRRDCGITRIRNFAEMRVAFVAPYLFGKPDSRVINDGKMTKNQLAVDQRCDRDSTYTLGDVRCEARHIMLKFQKVSP